MCPVLGPLCVCASPASRTSLSSVIDCENLALNGIFPWSSQMASSPHRLTRYSYCIHYSSLMVYTSPFTCGRIIGLWEAGVPITEIAKQFHTSWQAIQYKIDHYKWTGTGYPQYKKGRPRKLTSSDAKFAVLQLDQGRVQNAAKLHREYFQFVHPNTLRNMLK